MSWNNDGNPFEYTVNGWSQILKFPEFQSFDAGALKEFTGRQTSLVTTSPDDTASEDVDEDDDLDDEDIELDRLFEQGMFLVKADTLSQKYPPSPAQVRAYAWLTKHRSTVFRILVDHAYQHYVENIDGFRDFFNGEPQDRELLLPNISSPEGLKRLMRLMEIEVLEQTRDGVALITYTFDTTWLKDEFWEVTLCGEQFTTEDSAPFPFSMPERLDWKKLPVTREGQRFAEFEYRGAWTGTFTINQQGVCTRQIHCPVCDGFDLQDPELITAMREAPSTHMVSTLVRKLKWNDAVRPALTLVAPLCFVLGWWGNPLFYWGTIAVCVLAAFTNYVANGWRWSGWVSLAIFEGLMAGSSLLPKPEPRFDTAPDWTVFSLFEQFVWLTSVAITAAWWYGMVGVARHPVLRTVIYTLAAFGLVQIAALVYVAYSKCSSLHLLWFTPLAMGLTAVLALRQFRFAMKRKLAQSLGMGTDGQSIEDAWRQILEQMEKRGPGGPGGTVFEAEPRSKKESGNADE